MKKCTYCGKEYTDEALECTIDRQPLAPFPPKPELIADDLHDKIKTVTIRLFGSHEAAELAAANLEAHEIPCWVSADDCGGMYPNLTVAAGVRVLVRASDSDAAIALLDAQASSAEINQMQTEAAASAPPETVPLKKLSLWQILSGIVVGIILCLLYQQLSDLGERRYNHHTHGKIDKEWIYRDGHLVEFFEDRNLDGAWDHWSHYEHGEVVRSENDNNFDGKPDEWWTFSNDGTDALQKDNDFNGIPDEFCTYKKRVIQQIDMKPNGSKFSATREIFRNGVLTEILCGGDSDGNFKEDVKYDPFFNPIRTNTFPAFKLLTPN